MYICFLLTSSQSPCDQIECRFGAILMFALYASDSVNEGMMMMTILPVIVHAIKEEEEFYKLLPANKADHLCQSWQSCSDLHKIQTVYDIVENPHSIRLSKK